MVLLPSAVYANPPNTLTLTWPALPTPPPPPPTVGLTVSFVIVSGTTTFTGVGVVPVFEAGNTLLNAWQDPPASAAVAMVSFNLVCIAVDTAGASTWVVTAAMEQKVTH